VDLQSTGIITNRNIQNVAFILSHTDDDQIRVFEEILERCDRVHIQANGVIAGTNQSPPFHITGVVPSDILVILDLTGSLDQPFNTRIDFLWPHLPYIISDVNDANLIPNLTDQGRFIFFAR
jgi:hypothetical protein